MHNISAVMKEQNQDDSDERDEVSHSLSVMESE